KVAPGSPADSAGIVAGDKFWRADCRPAGDIIDYRIWEADEQVRLLVQTGNRPVRRIIIRKAAHEPLGLQFNPPTIAPLQRCRNRCLFCFVDQNPPGLRRSLYLKDDDYRLSFLYGNYITLNHLTVRELKRIVKLQLSPLYVSVQTTDPQLRSRLFRNRQASRGLKYLRYLLGLGIKIHAQVVLCPGYNLGPDLLSTVTDLESMGEAVLSVAVVPVGLTAHGAPPKTLRRLNPDEASRVVEQITKLQHRFLKRRGSRFVFLSDELYRLAGADYPGIEQYEGFPQLENGVGMARLFLEELVEMERSLPPAFPRLLRITLVTGVEAAHLLEQMMPRLAAINNLEAQLIVLKNQLFGPSVTVAGLLAGDDLKDGLQNIIPGEAVFFPGQMLKDGDNLFLDGITLNQVESCLQVPLIPVDGPRQLAWEINKLVSVSKGKTGVAPERGGDRCPAAW
ncbi:MAG TPA: DUF512 domain-containing protein, partial [Firmicutes bacterium]|nr:DUF512 domain-containing protein [Bacillota bacterium]